MNRQDCIAAVLALPAATRFADAPAIINACAVAEMEPDPLFAEHGPAYVEALLSRVAEIRAAVLAQATDAFDPEPSPNHFDPIERGPEATVAQLIACLTDTEQAAVQSAIDKATLAARTWWADSYRRPVPIANPKVGRIAASAGLDLAGWFARAAAAL